MLNLDGVVLPELNFRITTVKYLRGLTPQKRNALLEELVVHNITALRKQLEVVKELPLPLRMWRIGSDLLPLYTHPIATNFYKSSAIQDLITKRLTWCGTFARKHTMRLSFHPAQFVVLGSQNPGVRESSIQELQYHCEVFTRMGYKGWHPDGLSVNIHVGVKNADVKAMRKLLKSTTEVANFTTLENDEFSWSTSEILETFGDLVPLVLDVHHHWIHHGERLQPTDPIVDTIKASWRGVQPKLHLAMSHPELCESKPKAKLELAKLLDAGNTRSGLRAHSMHPWHTRSIDYAATFGFDIMWEGKDKNLGAYYIAKHLGLIEL